MVASIKNSRKYVLICMNSWVLPRTLKVFSRMPMMSTVKYSVDWSHSTCNSTGRRLLGNEHVVYRRKSRHNPYGITKCTTPSKPDHEPCLTKLWQNQLGQDQRRDTVFVSKRTRKQQRGLICLLIMKLWSSWKNGEELKNFLKSVSTVN